MSSNGAFYISDINARIVYDKITGEYFEFERDVFGQTRNRGTIPTKVYEALKKVDLFNKMVESGKVQILADMEQIKSDIKAEMMVTENQKKEIEKAIKASLTKAKADAKKQAIKIADKEGLDEASKLELIDKMVKEAEDNFDPASIV